MKNNNHLFEWKELQPGRQVKVAILMVDHGDKEEDDFYSESSHPGSQLGPFYVNLVSK